MADELNNSKSPSPSEEEGASGIDVAGMSPEDDRVRELLAHTIDVPVLAEAVEQQEAADAADTLERLEEGALEILEQMEDVSAAEALAEMESPLAVSVLEDLVDEGKSEYAGRLLYEMAPDDAADLLQAFDETQRDVLLELLPAEEAADLRRLALYEEDTAGGLMTTDFLSLRVEMTIGEAIDAVRESEIPRGVQHLMVTDDAGVLVGVIALRTLLLSRPSTSLGEAMEETVAAVRFDLDQEAVAQQFDRYDYYMLAVVDYDDRLLGIVTVDDVIDIIRAEQTEDVQRTVGAGAGEAVYSGLGDKLKGRFPWLFVNLFTTGLAALVVMQFEDLISQLAILAVLMPIIAAQAGNAGHQSLAVTLRGIVLDEVRQERVWPLVIREFVVGLLTGAALGLIVLVGLGVLSNTSVIDGASWPLGVVAALSMAVSTGAGTLAGVSIPLLMRRFGADPAMASAIFLIMITDAVSFATFLGTARLSAHWLGI